jgi:uncharacterized glyoxalase superfamily protein PhnB
MQQGSTVIPGLRYRDAHAAIAWLERVFGFERKAVYEGPGGTVQHAELRLGGGMVMLGSVRDEGPHAKFSATPEEAGGRVTSGCYLVVPDCGPVWERAREAGAEVVMELQTMSYGGQSFSVRDPEGYLWSVGEYDPWNKPA